MATRQHCFGKIYLFILLLTCNGVKASTVSDLMEKWLSIEVQKGKLQNEWVENERLLEQQLSYFRKEADVHRNRLAETDTHQSEIEYKRQELILRQTQLEQQQVNMAAQLASSISFLQQIHHRLPPPLQEQMQGKLSQVNDSNLSTSQRLEHTLSLMQMIDEFNQRIAIHQDIITVTDNNGTEKPVFVSQYYAGIASAWYIDSEGEHFGYGRPESSGWAWYHTDRAEQLFNGGISLDDISNLEQILRSPTSASFISLPVALETLGEQQ